VNTDAYTIKRYIEYPSGTFTQVTWSSATSVTVSPGTIVASDVLSLTIPAGTKFWERTVNLSATVTHFPIIELPASSIALGVDDGNSATDQGNSGTIAASSGATTFGSVVIECNIASVSARSFVVVGDSIPWGQGDVSSTDAWGNSGYVARTLGVHGYPYMKITKQSETAHEFATFDTKPKALIQSLFYTDAICEFGVNDLSGGASQATLLADLQTIYGIFTGGKNIFQTTLTSKSTSTDSWATQANQTAGTTGNMGNLGSVNTAIRVPQANVNVVLDAANASMPSLNADIWISPPAPTTDGVHPNSYMANVMAAALAGGL
jgi:lysophospholipase L1-like esterase